MATKNVRPERRSESTALSERLLDLNEAAAAIVVKPATLYQWAYQRRLPVVKLFGPRGALRFREGDIRALIARSVLPALRPTAEDRGDNDNEGFCTSPSPRLPGASTSPRRFRNVSLCMAARAPDDDAPPVRTDGQAAISGRSLTACGMGSERQR
jgi:predicted DNA-binding transcriptional regulator AlpA